MPAFLPDGRHFLFASPNAPSSNHAAIRLGALDSLESRILLEADSNAVYASGRLLFPRESAPMAQPSDPDRLALGGEAVPVAEHVRPRGPSAFDVKRAN